MRGQVDEGAGSLSPNSLSSMSPPPPLPWLPLRQHRLHPVCPLLLHPSFSVLLRDTTCTAAAAASCIALPCSSIHLKLLRVLLHLIRQVPPSTFLKPSAFPATVTAAHVQVIPTHQLTPPYRLSRPSRYMPPSVACSDHMQTPQLRTPLDTCGKQPITWPTPHCHYDMSAAGSQRRLFLG